MVLGHVPLGVSIEDHMLKTATEVVKLIGVAAAIIAGSFYAMGTVAHVAYLDAFGFDAHQFPPLGLELHVLGLLSLISVVWAAPLSGLVALAYVLLSPLTPRFTDWLSRQPPAKWRMPGSAIIVGAVECWLAAARSPFGKRILQVVGCYLIGVLILAAVYGSAYKVGNARATEAGNNHATTTIEFTDGHKIPAPGARVVCSERFCGFHDGTTATVISLEGVRSIRSPAPQERPAQPDDAGHPPAAAGAPGPDK